MRKNSEAISKEVQDLMVQARHQAAARLHKVFKTQPMIEAIGAERAALLTEHTALGSATLGWVSAQMREAIIERRLESRLRQFALWHIIDGIGNLLDCEPGRWPYFTDQDRRLRMQWTSDELDAIEGAVAEVVAAEESVPA
jgi:hypothetical protein